MQRLLWTTFLAAAALGGWLGFLGPLVRAAVERSRTTSLSLAGLLAVLLVLVLLGARWGFGKVRLPAPLRLLVATGLVFVFVGALIGPQGANLLTAETLRQLSPVLVIGLGWIGFLYGSHFEWRLRPRQPAPPSSPRLLETPPLPAAEVSAGRARRRTLPASASSL